ncbi:MAG: radical SAM protein [Candidatus Methanospirareceae archaeon]
MTRRNLLYLTLSEIEPRVWFMLTGCNFRCKGCFRPARDSGGTPLTASETLELMEKACLNYYHKIPAKALITGGEPTLDKDYLLGLVTGLHERAFSEIVLMTNGYALGTEEQYVRELEAAGLTEAHVDVKAFSDDIHRDYTGKSNQPVLKAVEQLNASGIKLLVQTIYMPGLVEASEIEQIAQFLARINRDIQYRINPFVPTFAFEKVTRRPTLDEIERAYELAAQHLPNTIISRSCYREYPTPPPQKTWITVYPDLTTKRRGMKDQMQDRLSWLSQTRSCESKEDWQKEAWDFTLRHSLVGISETSGRQSGPGEEKGSGWIKVKFPLSLHEVTKTRWTELDCDGPTTIEAVMKRLADRYSEKFRETLLATDGKDGGELTIKRSFNLYLNGMNIKNLQGMQTGIRAGDELIILSWVSGG